MTKNDPLEKTIQRSVVYFARGLGFLAYKMSSQAQNHLPDYLFVSPYGEIFFIEFKRLGKMPTVGQQHMIQQLRARGVDVHIVDRAETGKEIIAHYAAPR